MTVPGQPPAPATPCGRFAPTPSGPLHAGSLATALGSWLAARAVGGRWLLRLDDLDTPRNQPGADARIEQQLRRHGLVPDATVRSSALAPRHAAALENLRARGLAYPCNCTRARLREHARPGPWGPVYDGHCRRHPPTGDGPVAWRLALDPAAIIAFTDALHGPQASRGADLGDPVLRRADGITGYALACAVDEAALAVTNVVRGADLLGSTFAQVAILDALALPAPAYAHLPVLHGPDGRKLSKQNHAPALADGQEAENLRAAARHLGLLDSSDPALTVPFGNQNTPDPTLYLARLLAACQRHPPPWCAR